MFSDQTLTDLTGFFNGRNLEHNIVTLLAIPGSGKTRSVAEAVIQAEARMKRINLVGGLPTKSKVSDILSTLEGSAEENQTVVVHFDEVLAVLAQEHSADDLQQLARTCILFAKQSTRRKFVFTGTNINTKAHVRLGKCFEE